MYLEFDIVQHLLLLERPLIKVVNLALQIARRALRARNIGDQRCLLLAQFEQLLTLPKHGLFDRVEFALHRLQRGRVLVVVRVDL